MKYYSITFPDTLRYYIGSWSPQKHGSEKPLVPVFASADSYRPITDMICFKPFLYKPFDLHDKVFCIFITSISVISFVHIIIYCLKPNARCSLSFYPLFKFPQKHTSNPFVLVLIGNNCNPPPVRCNKKYTDVRQRQYLQIPSL